MLRSLAAIFCVGLLCSCSSAGIHSVRNHSGPVRQAPSMILVEPFSGPLSVFQLGDRPLREREELRRQIIRDLARSTSTQLRRHAAASAVVSANEPLRPGTWLVRGEILRVDQGSRALRATVGFGSGRTEMRTRVRVFEVTPVGVVPLLSFQTKGTSGLEPGAALGVATGGVGTVASAGSAAFSLAVSSLPGVSSDIDRTSYEIAAVLSLHLQKHGLLDRSREPIEPRMKGQLPTTINFQRMIPAPLRGQD